VIRLERAQNRFFSYAAYLLKTEHPQHDYSQIRSKLNTPLLSNYGSEANLNLILSVLNGSIEVVKILSSIQLCALSHNTRNHNLLYIPPHSISYVFNHPLHRIVRTLNDTSSHFFILIYKLLVYDTYLCFIYLAVIFT